MKSFLEKTPIDENELPINRKQLFIRAFKKDYSTILFISIFASLFFLPTIVLFFIMSIETSYANLETQEAMLNVFNLRRWFYILLIPALSVFSIGAAGLSNVTKKLVWNQATKFFGDFASGIKKEWWRYLAVTLIFSVFISSVCYGADLLNLASNGQNHVYVLLGEILLFIIAFGLLIFQYSGLAIYKTSVLSVIKNSVILTLGTLPKTILIVFLMALPIILLMIFGNVMWLYVIIVTILTLIGFGYEFLIGTLYCHHVFDKYVNEKEFISIYRKGLYNRKPESEKH